MATVITKIEIFTTGTASSTSNQLYSYTNTITTPTAVLKYSPVVAVVAPGITIDFAPLGTTLYSFEVTNKSTTASVTCNFTSAAGAQSVVLAPGEFAVIPEATIAGDLTLISSVGTAECDVVAWGA